LEDEMSSKASHKKAFLVLICSALFLLVSIQGLVPLEKEEAQYHIIIKGGKVLDGSLKKAKLKRLNLDRVGFHDGFCFSYNYD